MNRRRALVVVPVLLLCVAGVWLLARGERDDPRRVVGPQGPTTTPVTEAGPANARPGPTLAPPVATTTPAPQPPTEVGPVAATEAGPDAPAGQGPGATPPGVRLRGVRGRVVSAVDGQPIRGAFVSWGAPPAKVLDAIRSSPALLEAGEGGEITDASGRFELPRVDDDRPRPELYASAAGWLQASTVVGLREQVELRLARAGRLAVRMAGAVGDGGAQEIPSEALHQPQPDLRSMVGVVAEGPGGARHADRWRGWPPFLEVAPGSWRVRVDGAAPVEALVRAGELTTVEVAAAWGVVVEGTIDAAPGSTLLLVRTGELGSTAPLTPTSDYELRVLEGGKVRGQLPPGVYSARVEEVQHGTLSEESSERAVTAPVRVPRRAGPVELELPLSPRVEVVVQLDPAGLDRPAALGLVSVEGDPPDLFALPGPGSGQASTPTRYAGAVPAGRWLVFLGPAYAGEVELAEGTPATLTLRPFDVTVRWRVPDALRDGEVLRGALAVVPAELARRPVGARFREEATEPFDASRGGEPFRLQLLAPGRYLLCGATDLGPFEREVELTGGAEVEVDLTAR